MIRIESLNETEREELAAILVVDSKHPSWLSVYPNWPYDLEESHLVKSVDKLGEARREFAAAYVNGYGGNTRFMEAGRNAIRQWHGPTMEVISGVLLLRDDSDRD